jgi:hypothetical protein
MIKDIFVYTSIKTDFFFKKHFLKKINKYVIGFWKATINIINFLFNNKKYILSRLNWVLTKIKLFLKIKK